MKVQVLLVRVVVSGDSMLVLMGSMVVVSMVPVC
jgi:hypothetical protein